jgi:hypothetical protein
MILTWEKECQSTTLSPAFHHLDSYVIPFFTWPLVHVMKVPTLTHMTLQPAVVLELWYAGTPSDAQKAFAPLFSLKPIYQDSSPTPYNEINAVLDRGQYKGGQKPTWSVALEKLDPAAARELWKHYLAFRLLHPSAKDSVVMFECYAFGKVRQVPDESTAFPWRALNFHV